MNRTTLILAALTAVLIASLAYTRAAEAQSAGTWACYIGDKFPEVQEAREWRGSRKVEQGLNEVAAHVPAGEIITVPYPIKAGMGSQVSAPLICVKH